MSEKQHTQWVECGRLHMGATATDKRLEMMMAVQECTVQCIHQLSREVTRTNETSKNLTNWGNNQRKCYEQLVCGVLVRHLENQGYTDVTPEDVEIYRKTRSFTDEDGVVVDSVEWDGLILCMKGDTKMMFFLEAKKTQDTKGMLNIPQRLGRTMRFIEACTKQLVPPAQDASQRYKNLCLMWNRCSGRDSRCVLAADVIPSLANDMAVENKYITIRSGDGAFHLMDMDGTSTVFYEDKTLGDQS